MYDVRDQLEDGAKFEALPSWLPDDILVPRKSFSKFHIKRKS